ncbi:MAG: CdvA-like protein [Candidatus Bathyarchaeota archaeon]|nr:CdvA-like protein [Candidatus Bathyarchaeota archaeon]
MISWKYSFKRLSEEYEIAMKKKQALDNLFKTGRISEATRNSFENDINAVISEIEKQQKDLVVKMQGKMQELESQIKTLETLLANYEIQHVIGEIDEESYQREITLLSTGLETAKHELDSIKEAINQLCSPVKASVTEPSPAATIEAAQNAPVEDKPAAPADADITAEPIPEEPAVTTEQVVQEQQPEIVSEETIPAELTQTAESTPEVLVETPATAENQAVITEEVPQQAAPIPEVVEETPKVTEEPSQNTEIPKEKAVEPEIKEETLQVTEDTSDITEPSPEATEEILQVIESSPEIVEEIGEKAHPQKAPEEAHQVITESTSEQEQDIEEVAATAETEENTETEET